MLERAGYRELEHTADWELEVWAPDLGGLLEQAARGMYALMGVEVARGPRARRRVEVAGADREDLLVAFLEELLYLAERDGLAFDRFHLEIGGPRVVAELEGGRIGARTKEIKAVTYHRLEVRETEDGIATRVVFDV